ncbi:unnamed protein product [Schistosoma rodhaini]|uniref:Putative nad dependent epimerase/dehydratase n=1 Tax=Schistosoma mansoni TaxID=6183 RepID=A0A5K4EVK1_SCHMA|nr:unnamed protein product [Schistosoma rodhaini]
MSESSNDLLVIGAGLPRTGTKSLKNALEIIYHKPCYHMTEIIIKQQNDIDKWQKLFDEALKMESTNELIIQDGLKEILNNYEAVTDVPACGFYKELMNIYPNAKVLLTIRDKYDRLHSLRKVVLPKSNDPWKLKIEEGDKVLGLNSDFYKLTEDSLKFAFQKDDLNFDDDQVLLECYDEYNRLVQETVPSDRLLVLRLGDGWEPLCKFLNVEIPNGIDYSCINSHHQMTQLTEQLIKHQSLDTIIHMFPDWI